MYDVRVVPEAIADAARRRSDEAVRRLRAESLRRIEGRRPGMSPCMLGTMLSLLLFVALQSRRIYWAGAHTEEIAPPPAPALNADVEMPRAEDVKVTGFVPRPDGRGRRSERRRCVAEYDLLTGERYVNCSTDRKSRPRCGGSGDDKGKHLSF